MYWLIRTVNTINRVYQKTRSYFLIAANVWSYKKLNNATFLSEGLASSIPWAFNSLWSWTFLACTISLFPLACFLEDFSSFVLIFYPHVFLRNIYHYVGHGYVFFNFTALEAKARVLWAPGQPGLLSGAFLKTK